MLLNLEGVNTFYGNFQASRGVSLSIEKGEIVALLVEATVQERPFFLKPFPAF
jgi:ABC-type branched-subunit amino acid transport system ATPase component